MRRGRRRTRFRRPHTRQSDCWAAGCILAELLVCVSPDAALLSRGGAVFSLPPTPRDSSSNPHHNTTPAPAPTTPATGTVATTLIILHRLMVDVPKDSDFFCIKAKEAHCGPATHIRARHLPQQKDKNIDR